MPRKLLLVLLHACILVHASLIPRYILHNKCIRIVTPMGLPKHWDRDIGFLQDVHFAGLLDVRNIISADTGISRQTESHSFGDT
jgi:hypothetical protein